MRGFAILLSFHFIGLLLREWLHVPLPANVIGLILFIVCLFAGWIKIEWVEQSAQFLIRHMMLFFAPFVVGTIVFVKVIGSNIVGIGLSLIVGTMLVMIVTAKVTELLSGKRGAQDERQMVE
ncbi:MAG: hypothetical protein K0Q59_1604 [Paenibacillus sp.]|nr:hypothetical protein [Paenibacillus sp.]